MRAYAKQQFGLNAPATRDSKTTRRQSLEQVQKTTGKQLPELVPLPLPEPMRQVWLWYNDVRSGDRLTYAELLAWVAVCGVRPERHELRLIKELDNLFWELYYDRD